MSHLNGLSHIHFVVDLQTFTIFVTYIRFNIS